MQHSSWFSQWSEAWKYFARLYRSYRTLWFRYDIQPLQVLVFSYPICRPLQTEHVGDGEDQYLLWNTRIHCARTPRKSGIHKDCRLVDTWRTSLWNDGQTSYPVVCFGCINIIYQQTGLPPFFDENVNIMYQRILADPLNFPPDMPSEARSVMTGLLQRDPNKRLGVNGGEEIKKHPFFSKYIDWNR